MKLYNTLTRQKEEFIKIGAIEKDYVEIACELWLQPRTPSFTYARKYSKK